MIWLILSLLTALAVASQDAWVKKHFSHLTAYDMLAFPSLFSLPLFIVSLLFVTVPPLDEIFYWSFLISLPINFVSFLIYMKAIRVSPLSLTLPYLAFMISVKRLSALIGIIYGRLFFKEKHIAVRFVGACLMVTAAPLFWV